MFFLGVFLVAIDGLPLGALKAHALDLLQPVFEELLQPVDLFIKSFDFADIGLASLKSL